MKKFVIQIALLLIVIIVALYILNKPDSISQFGVVPSFVNIGQTAAATKQIKINETIVKVEVADTQAKRAKGLSGRESLATDSGMLFVFPEEKAYQFWMKGMNIPLDFIFINKGKVVDLLPNIQPPESGQETNLPIYQPVAPIDMMLEVNSGYIERHQIKVGDTVYQVK